MTTSPEAALSALRTAYPAGPELAARLHAELDALEDTVRAAAAHWTTVQPGREWTPAQEAEHAVIVNEGSGKLARLLLSDRPLRPMTAEPGVYRGDKRQAPPSTWPGGGLSAEDVLSRSAATRALLTEAAGAPADPSRTAPHPFMGELDAADWLRMAAYHTRHHRKLLQAGLAALDGR